MNLSITRQGQERRYLFPIQIGTNKKPSYF